MDFYSSTAAYKDYLHRSTLPTDKDYLHRINIPTEKDYLHRSILPTDYFQASLPRLPIPGLEDTLRKYLESQRPILTDAEYEQTVDIVNKFKVTEGPGKNLVYEKTLQ
jgi:hypothetical protein